MIDLHYNLGYYFYRHHHHNWASRERAHLVVQLDRTDCMYVYPERKEARLRRRRERLAAETEQREMRLSKAPCYITIMYLRITWCYLYKARASTSASRSGYRIKVASVIAATRMHT